MKYLKKILDENSEILGKDSVEHLCDLYEKKQLQMPSFSGPPVMGVPAQQEYFSELLKISQKKSDKRSIYIHIPFCQTKCDYCAFYQNPTTSKNLNSYVDALVKEIKMLNNYEQLKELPFHAIYFGGGTPTDLEPKHISSIMIALKETLEFANDVEFTVESRFKGLSKEKIDTWVSFGMNRISLGVQSFDTKIRQSLGRRNTQEEILSTIKDLVNDGRFLTVIDLMYGLPLQSSETWKKDIQLLMDCGVDGADIYQLVLLEKTLLSKNIESNKISYNFENKEKYDYFDTAMTTLEDHGYNRISTQHVSKNSRERNFYNTFTKAGCFMLPLGCGSGGKIENSAIMHTRDLKQYIELVNAGNSPIGFMTRNMPSSLLQKEFEIQLNGGVINKLLLKQYMCEEEKVLLDEITEFLLIKGLLKKDSESRYSLTRAGEFWYTNLTVSIQKIFKLFKKGI